LQFAGFWIFFQGFAIRPGGGIELISEVIRDEVRKSMYMW
jgi:hypothetical protein